jgi:monoterpene epsilon-lactone hydrolase
VAGKHKSYITYHGGESPSREAEVVAARYGLVGGIFAPAFYDAKAMAKDPPEVIALDRPDMQFARVVMPGLPVQPEFPDCRTVVKTGRLNDLPTVWVCAEGASETHRLLFLHGGGYSFGNIYIYQFLMAHISRVSGCSVFAIDYRKAPEHPFPSGLNDALEAYRHILMHGPSGRSETTHVRIAGDSAGGGLALSLALKIRDLGLTRPECLVALSPATDLTQSSESLSPQERAGGRGMFRGYYADASPEDPYVSPLFGDLTGFPSLLIQVSDTEGLRDDSFRFAERAHLAGVDVNLEIWRNMVHVHQLMVPFLPEAVDAVQSIGRFIKRYE